MKHVLAWMALAVVGTIGAGIGLVLGAGTRSPTPCPLVSAWPFLKADCQQLESCQEDRVRAVIQLTTKTCQDGTVDLTIPAVRSMASSLLAETETRRGRGANALWSEAEAACLAAGGADCSRSQLAAIAITARGADSERP